MKRWLPIVVLALLAMPALADGETLRAEWLVARVPQSAGLGLRGELRDAPTVGAGVAKLQRMIARGAATLIGMPVVWTDGRLETAETVEEIRYRTAPDFGPGPQNFQPSQIRPPEPPSAISQVMTSLAFDIPVNFETRNAGLSLEIAPTFYGGRSILLGLAASHTRFDGLRPVLSLSGAKGDLRFAQPHFSQSRTSTSFLAIPDQWRLLAVTVVRGSSPALEFQLLRVTLHP